MAQTVRARTVLHTLASVRVQLTLKISMWIIKASLQRWSKSQQVNLRNPLRTGKEAHNWEIFPSFEIQGSPHYKFFLKGEIYSIDQVLHDGGVQSILSSSRMSYIVQWSCSSDILFWRKLTRFKKGGILTENHCNNEISVAWQFREF